MAVRVPVCFIRKLCYPHSVRLPHLERLVFPPPKPVVKIPLYQSNYNAAFGNLENPLYPRLENQYVSWDKGNLRKDEYRFFYGSSYVRASTSTCRWCFTKFNTVGEREDHRRSGCNKKLCGVYGKALSKGKCVVCSAYTTRAVWGVPLCSEICRKNWQFEMPGALRLCISAQKVQSKEVL